jgi:phytoene dehydrogenase-like protein
MHASGTLEGEPGAWGYVQGGMGRISFALADAALEAGAVLATGAEVAAIIPGEGVRLDGGEVIRAPVVVSNADPRRTLALCEDKGPESFRRRVAQWRIDSPVLKINCALTALPTFAAAGSSVEPHRAMVTISTGIDATQAAYERSRRGEPAPSWCELYFHTAYDASVAPAGRHAMSIFAQYVPYQLAEGDWDSRRQSIADAAIAEVERFAPGLAGLIEQRQVLGPPDIESRMGLTGGHIFQGDCLAEQLWEGRFGPRLPLDGVYLCGAATHPGGSVIAVNGRNAAMAVLRDADG